MFKSINGGKLPQRATRHSAGFDVFANEDVYIGAGQTKIINLGICLAIETMDDDVDLEAISEGYYLELHPRSSLRAKGLGGGVGIIDIDYRDEIKMVITHPINYALADVESVEQGYADVSFQDVFLIKKGDKIGQLIMKHHEAWLLPSEYTLDADRNGGFGSTNQ